MKPFDALKHAAGEMVIRTKLGIHAAKKLLGGCLKRPWPPLIKMNAVLIAKVGKLFLARNQ